MSYVDHNMYGQLLGNDPPASSSNSKKKKKKKKKKKSKSDGGENSNVQVTETPTDTLLSRNMVVAQVVDFVEPEDDLSGFVEPKKNLKKQQRKEKKKQSEDNNIATEVTVSPATPTVKTTHTSEEQKKPEKSDKRASKVHFGQVSESRSSSGRRKSNLKPSSANEESDVGIVKRLVDKGYVVGDVIDAIEAVEHSKAPHEVTTFEKVWDYLRKGPKSPTPPSPLLGKRSHSPIGARRRSLSFEDISVPDQENKEQEPASLIDRIEQQAMKWNPSDKNSISTIQKWVELLGEGEHPKHKAIKAHEGSVIFLHTFLESRALELVTRKILENGMRSTPRSLDNVIVTLFDLTLIGKKDYHRWLLNELKKLARTLELSSRNEDLIAKVLLVVNNQKQHFVARREFGDVLKQVRDEDYKKSDTGKSVDPRSVLEDVCNSAAESVHLHEEQLFHIRDALQKIMSADELSLSFRSLEREIEATKVEAKRSLEEKISIRDALSNKKVNIEGEKKNRYDTLRNKQRTLMGRRAELEKKKAELESMLRKVENDLNQLTSEETKTNLALATLDESYSNSAMSLEKKEEELAFEIATLAKDNEASDAISKFMGTACQKVMALCQRDHDELQSNYERIQTNYLQEVKAYVGNEQSLLKFLKERIVFCKNKLAEGLEERNRMAQLGLLKNMNVDPSLEENMKSMIKDDNASIQSICSKVQTTFANVKKYADFSSPAYAAFWNFLHDKQSQGKLAFQMSRLPTPTAAAAGVMQQPMASSPRSPKSAPVSSATPASPSHQVPIIPSSLPVPNGSDDDTNRAAVSSGNRPPIGRPRKPPGFMHSPVPRKVTAANAATEPDVQIMEASTATSLRGAWGTAAPVPAVSSIANSSTNNSAANSPTMKNSDNAPAPNRRPKRGPMARKKAPQQF